MAELFAIILPTGEGAGLGYVIQKDAKWFHRYSINHETKIIYLDDVQMRTDFTNNEAAEALSDAIVEIKKHIAFQDESFWGGVGRIALGTGMTVLGGVETVVGVVGIIVPEPGTTAAGVAVTTVGVATMGEGVSMIFGRNYGEEYNFLEEGFAEVGDLIGGDSGEDLARTTFLIANLFVSLGGSFKILKVPNQSFLFKGHWHNGHTLVQASGDGYTVGRLQLMFKLRSGRDIVNVTNNSNKWILRLQHVDGSLVVNGRIIGVQKAHRINSPSELLSLLAKLILHGF